ncbi:hypothetical protein [Pseudomonas sp. RC10]|uniref:hypothetical protein n=1 Tax=Pseudomonas bambusae TaxID=3139142 RepID=UPI003138FE06
MAVPQITLLPPPPTPSDTPEVFASKSGVFVTAEVVMVPEINTALQFINDTAVDANEAIEASATAVAAKNAAVVYAAQAQASATAAESAQGSLGNLALIYAIALAS